MRTRATSLILLLVLAACKPSSSSSAARVDPGVRPSAEAPARVDARERALARLITRMLESEHLRARPLDDDTSTKAFERFLERLDASKLFLLDEHVASLREHSLAMDDQMREGRMRLAHTAAELLEQRVDKVATLVEHQLAQPFDFERDESVETDPEKLAFAGSDDELSERWRRVLKLDVLMRVVRMEELEKARAEAAAASAAGGAAEGAAEGDRSAAKDPAGGSSGAHGAHGEGDPDAEDELAGDPQLLARYREIPASPEGKEKKAREAVAKSYAGRFARLAQREPLDYIEMFVNAIAEVYDPHTAYLPPVRKENFDIEMSGSLEGIGAVLAEDDEYIRVSRIVPGSASWREGQLEAGDLILAVGQGADDPVDVAHMRLNTVVQLIRGPKGSVVTLTVQKPDGRVVIIGITRDVVEIAAAYAKGAVLRHPELAGPVGYIDLPSFYGNTRSQPGQTRDRDCTDDVRALIEQLTARGVKQIVLDLRGNGGGLLQDAEEMSGLFIESGPIVQTRDAGGDREVLVDNDPQIAFGGDVVVLVDQFSASASEILAGALQDYRRAVVVGTGPTHGKGTVQILLNLDAMADGQSELGVVKLTRQQFFRITGASTQLRGVEPDITLPNPTAYIESGERHLDYPIPWSSVEPLYFQAWPAGVGDVAALAARSRTRQLSNAALQRIRKATELLEKQRDATLEPLRLTAWREQRQRRQEAVQALNVGSDAKAPLTRLSVSVVDYDGSFAAEPPPRPGRQPQKSTRERWRESLVRDPFLEETLLILGDMRRERAQAGARTPSSR